MNIFVTSPCPIQSANFMDDKRATKMALESAQMLCTALNLNSVKTPYKTAHPNHPCTVWVTKSRNNFLWLWEHGMALCKRYTRTYGKIHACEKVFNEIKHLNVFLPDTDMTEFVNCARNQSQGVDYTGEKDIHVAYQLYLNDRWDNDKREPTFIGVLGE